MVNTGNVVTFCTRREISYKNNWSKWFMYFLESKTLYTSVSALTCIFVHIYRLVIYTFSGIYHIRSSCPYSHFAFTLLFSECVGFLMCRNPWSVTNLDVLNMPLYKEWFGSCWILRFSGTVGSLHLVDVLNVNLGGVVSSCVLTCWRLQI